MWQKLVKEKLSNQAALIGHVGNEKTAEKIKILSQRVFSGDSDNKEAQAARLYWPALFGKGFLRSDDDNAINSFLNYGYAILRSSICRAIVAFGLLPMLGFIMQISKITLQWRMIFLNLSDHLSTSKFTT